MQNSIKKMEQTVEDLRKSISLVKKGDFEALTRYFQTGYNHITGHIPSYILDKEYEIKERYALLLNEKLAKSKFNIKVENVSKKGEFELFYEENFVGNLNPHKKEAEIVIPFDEKEKEHKVILSALESKKRELQERLMDIQKFSEEKEKKMKKGSKKILFEKIKESLNSIPKQIEKFDEELSRIEKEKALLQEIYTALETLRETLSPYGYCIK